MPCENRPPKRPDKVILVYGKEQLEVDPSKGGPDGRIDAIIWDERAVGKLRRARKRDLPEKCDPNKPPAGVQGLEALALPPGCCYVNGVIVCW